MMKVSNSLIDSLLYISDHFKKRQLLKAEEVWYKNCAHDKSYMIDYISDLVESEPAWHPSPRPDFSLTSEQTDRIRQEATEKLEALVKVVNSKLRSDKHNYNSDEEILNNGRFKKHKTRTRGGNRYRFCSALPCPVLPCPALRCPSRPCPALPFPALPCLYAP